MWMVSAIHGAMVQSVVFDETYIHYAENNTDQNRIIFFADVERPLKTRFMERFNHWFGKKSHDRCQLSK